MIIEALTIMMSFKKIVQNVASYLKGYSEIIAVTAPSIFIKSEIFAFL